MEFKFHQINIQFFHPYSFNEILELSSLNKKTTIQIMVALKI